MVVAVSALPDDPRTIDAWARALGICRSSLKARCAAAAVNPKDSLDFARLLLASQRFITSSPLIAAVHETLAARRPDRFYGH